MGKICHFLFYHLKTVWQTELAVKSVLMGLKWQVQSPLTLSFCLSLYFSGEVF